MRAAFEIYNKIFNPIYRQDHFSDWEKDLIKSAVENCINEARIELIKECAEIATTKAASKRNIGEWYQVVDKQSILSLIEEVK